MSRWPSSSRIDLPAAFVQGQHVAEDRAVGVVVEIFGPDDEGDFVADFGQQQQAADDGPLGLDAARRLAIEQFADAVAGCTARLVFLPWPQVSIRR